MLKTFYANESEIPENLKAAYVAKNGRWELDDLANDHPVVVTKADLETNNKELKKLNTSLNQEKARLESSSLPEGKVAVDPEVEKLGQAAKAANLKAADIPTLATKAEDLQKQIDASTREKTITDVASSLGYNDKFVELAKDKNLSFEKATEKVGDKDTDVFYVVSEADGKTTKTKVDEFLKTDSFFSKFADTFAGEAQTREQGKQWTKQNSGKQEKGANIYDQIRNEKTAEQKQQPTANVPFSQAFATGLPPQAPQQ